MNISQFSALCGVIFMTMGALLIGINLLLIKNSKMTSYGFAVISIGIVLTGIAAAIKGQMEASIICAIFAFIGFLLARYSPQHEIRNL